jgi:hypothetical protein
MDTSDLIYIAIVLIGLISGFIKNRKKETKPNKKSKGNLEDLLNEFINPDKKKPTPSSAEPKHTVSAQQSVPLNSESIEHSDKTTAQIIKEHKANFKQKNEVLQDLQESDFNLREAIIHNTILNRPEY